MTGKLAPDLSDLRKKLLSLFLCKDSTMARAVDALLLAHEKKKPLEIAGRHNPGYDVFWKVAEALGVTCEESLLSGDPREPDKWAKKKSLYKYSAWIPGLWERADDYHIIIPFCLEYGVHELGELSEQGVKRTVPIIDNLFLLYIWHNAFNDRKSPLSERVCQYLAASNPDTPISVFPTSESEHHMIQAVFNQAMRLSRKPLAYLGFLRGNLGLELVAGTDLDDHPFNFTAREWIDDGIPMDITDTLEPMIPPFFARQFYWKADKISGILKNVRSLQKPRTDQTAEDPRTIAKCLEYRLRGESDSGIADKLGFKNTELYNQWLCRVGLDIDGGESACSFSKWTKICKEFGITVSKDAIGRLTGSPDIAALGSVEYIGIIRQNRSYAALLHKAPEKIDDRLTGKTDPDESRKKPVVVVNYRNGQISFNGNERRVSCPSHILKAVEYMITVYKTGSKFIDRRNLLEAIGDSNPKKKMSDLFKSYAPLNDLVRHHIDAEGRKPRNMYTFDINVRESSIEK